MKKLLFTCTMILAWSLGLMISEAGAQGTIYGGSLTTLNPSGRYVEGYSLSYMDYVAGLYWHPAVQGDLYRTDIPEPGLDSGYRKGYSNIIAAEVFLFSNNYVEGRTYCTYSTHFSIRRTTGVRIVSGVTQNCKTIPSAPTPTPTPQPTPTPVPTPSPTPCDPGIAGSCPDPQVSVSVTPGMLKPDGVAGGTNTARVSVCVQPAMANKDVTLQLVRRPQYVNSGGHIGSQHTGSRLLGKLARTSGRTGTDGCFSTTYTPSHISGWVGINGSMLGQTHGADPLVGVQGFGELLDGADYNLTGTTASHPFNHYGTPAAVSGLMQIANDYLTEFGPLQESQKIHYNDISLEYGGKFDLNRNWLPGGSHAEHREGINCDTRSNNIPNNRWARLNQIFHNRGSTRTNDETSTTAPHWHLRFLFGAPGVAAERTPHTFVEEVFGAALDRESSQAEYEVWLSRITNAKAQGQSQLLAEAKTFEQERFDSSEYIARQRTDEEFIADVFWSHLFREPTEHEAEDWLVHLQGIYALTQQGQRLIFLNDFEALPEFQSVIFGIVDPLPPPAPTPTP